MKKEETPKEFPPCGPQVQAQTQTISVSVSHRRFTDTRLWNIVHDPEFTSGGHVPADMDTVFDEFMLELESYGREDKNPAQRTRTLRFTRGRLAAARDLCLAGAGKKCVRQFVRVPCA